MPGTVSDQIHDVLKYVIRGDDNIMLQSPREGHSRNYRRDPRMNPWSPDSHAYPPQYMYPQKVPPLLLMDTSGWAPIYTKPWGQVVPTMWDSSPTRS